MEHLENAKKVFNNEIIVNKQFNDFIKIESNELQVKIQNGVISDNGVNGIQVTDLLRYINEVFKSLNNTFPCRENSLTITKIEEAIHWQDARTKDRLKRKVEGYNKV